MTEKEKKDSLIKKTPSIEELEGRFLFLEDKNLRDSVSIAFQYIIFLVSLETDYKLPGPIRYSFFKNVIIYTASIIECCLHYCIKKYKDNDLIKDSEFPKDWVYKDPKILYKITDKNEEVCGAIRFKKAKRFTDNITFKDINSIARKSGILTKDLFEKSDKLRDARNKIHLVSEKNALFFKQQDVDYYFKVAKLILDRIEDKLKSLYEVTKDYDYSDEELRLLGIKD